MLLRSLSSRLLLLTISFVMVIGIVIYVATITQFRLNYLGQKLAMAQTAALALEEMPSQSVSPMLEQEILGSAGLRAVIVLRFDSRQIMLRSDMPSGLVGRYDIANISVLDAVGQTYDTLARRGDGFIQVSGSSMSPRFSSVVFVMDEMQLYAAMIAYSRNLITATAIILVLAGTLAQLSLYRLVVRPMRVLCNNMTAFRKTPEDSRNTLAPSGRGDEIGMVEQELSRMQFELRRALAQKTRLANLGTAVSKISHDLRNILAASQMWADRAQSADSRDAADGDASQPFIDRLTASMDRAINLCERTLKYGKADEPPPEKTEVALRDLIDEVGLALGIDDGMQWNNRVAAELSVNADGEQLFRVFMNLGRNALQAMARDTRSTGSVGKVVTFTAEEDPDQGLIHILVADTGPGLPDKVRATLFKPFVGGTRGGTGLGLAIARELARAHGGQLLLEYTGSDGTAFRLCLPDAVPTSRHADKGGTGSAASA